MDHRKYLSKIGTRGGKAGTGQSKVRGDSEWYRKISKKRKLKKRDPKPKSG